MRGARGGSLREGRGAQEEPARSPRTAVEERDRAAADERPEAVARAHAVDRAVEAARASLLVEEVEGARPPRGEPREAHPDEPHEGAAPEHPPRQRERGGADRRRPVARGGERRLLAGLRSSREADLRRHGPRGALERARARGGPLREVEEHPLDLLAVRRLPLEGRLAGDPARQPPRLDGGGVLPARAEAERAAVLAEGRLEERLPGGGELPDGRHVRALEEAPDRGPNPGQVARGERGEEGALRAGEDLRDPPRLREVPRHLRRGAVGGDPDRHGEGGLRADRARHPLGRPERPPVQALGPGQVREEVVDRGDLDERRPALEDRAHRLPRRRGVLGAPPEEDPVGAAPRRLPQAHPGRDPSRARLVGAGHHEVPLPRKPPDDHRTTAQGRLARDLDRGEERVDVDMRDPPRRGRIHERNPNVRFTPRNSAGAPRNPAGAPPQPGGPPRNPAGAEPARRGPSSRGGTAAEKRLLLQAALTDAPARILLAEPSLAEFLAGSLKERGAQVEEATGATDARLCARRQRFAAAVVPCRLPLPGGGRLLDALAGESPGLALVAVGPLEAPEILAALRAGAREYLVEGGEDAGEAADRVLRAARPPAAESAPDADPPAEAKGLRLALSEARREIAERTDAFRELQEIFRSDLERMLLAFEHVGEGIVFADRAGGILLVNPAAGPWIGGTPHAAVGASLEGSITDPVLRGALREDRVRALSGTPSDRTLEGSDGRRIRLEIHPVVREGVTQGTLVLLRALTEEPGAGQNLRDLLRGVAVRLGRTARWLRSSGRPESTAIAPELEEAARQLRATLRARERGISPAVETPGSLP